MKERGASSLNGHSNGNTHEILGEIRRPFGRNGSVHLVTNYIRGHHPNLGILTKNGWQGDETIQEYTSVKPKVVISVED